MSYPSAFPNNIYYDYMRKRQPIRVDEMWGLQTFLQNPPSYHLDSFKAFSWVPGWSSFIDSRIRKQWETSGRHTTFNLLDTQTETMRRCEALVRGDGYVFPETMDCSTSIRVDDFKRDYHRLMKWEEKDFDYDYLTANVDTSSIPKELQVEGIPDPNPEEIPVCLVKEGKLHGTDSLKMYYWQHPLTLLSFIKKS